MTNFKVIFGAPAPKLAIFNQKLYFFDPEIERNQTKVPHIMFFKVRPSVRDYLYRY